MKRNSCFCLHVRFSDSKVEVVPNSSLVEDGVDVEVGVEVEVEVDATLSFSHSLDSVQILFQWVVGWVLWLEKWGLKLISTQVVVEVGVLRLRLRLG